jgi:predicted RNA-binding protein (virulence factor B family)
MELGRTQTLEIVKKVEFGVYLGTKEEQVLLPKKQVPENAQMGDEISVFVYRDSEDRMIATTNEPKIQLGETALLQVKDVSKNGAYLEWGLEKDLFLPFKEQIYEVKPGDEILVAMYIDKSNRLCATMKVYDYLKNNSLYEEEDMVNGVVYNFNPQYGAFVAVDGKYHGLVQMKELNRKVAIGEKLEARVKSVRPDGKLDLALRKKAYLQIDDDAAEILRYMEENGGSLGFTDKAKPEAIRSHFAMSKNEFKRAIGRLLKEGRVSIGENNIFLVK